MTEALLKFCGLKVESASRVAGAELALRNKQWLGWIIAIGIVLAVLTWISYRHDAVDMTTRLRRRVPPGDSIYNPVTAVLPGRRNNPPEPGLRPLAVFNPIHYFELPELFMEFI